MIAARRAPQAVVLGDRSKWFSIEAANGSRHQADLAFR
jgi:hypothetical protein